MNSDFKPPPLGWSILSTVGGVVTVVAAIFGLEHLSIYLHQTDASLAAKSTILTPNDGEMTAEDKLVALDTRSISNPGVPLPPAEMSARLAPTHAPTNIRGKRISKSIDRC